MTMHFFENAELTAMSLTVSIIQSELHWENKQANLDMFSRKIRELPSASELVILPEMFSTGFTMNCESLAETMEGETIDWMKRTSAANRVIITGSVIIKEGDRYFNRMIWMLPNGQFSYYDKRHLFGFAGENKYYTAGHQRLIASVNGWKINLMVCYDLRFPVWSRQSVSEGEAEYDLLIYVANWPEKRSHAWKTLLCARAIENQCFVAGVNRVGTDGNEHYYSGDSLLIDPSGEVLYHMAHREDVFTITLEKEKLIDFRRKFPFLRDADQFKIQP